MNDGTPFLVHEANVTLWLADAGGQRLTSANPVWLGALANSMVIEEQFAEVRLFSTGDEHARTQQLESSHSIELGKTWMVRRTTARPFTLRRNQRYVLEMVWQERRTGLPPAFWHWYSRRYFGVTIGRLRQASRSALQYDQVLRFDAESYEQDGGAGNETVMSPVDPGGSSQVLIFAKESPLLDGEYLGGAYRFNSAVTAENATVHAHGTLSTPVTLTLEVDGVLTAFTLTIGPDAGDVDDDVDLGDLVIPSGKIIRWKVTVAPIPEESGYNASVEMSVFVDS